MAISAWGLVRFLESPTPPEPRPVADSSARPQKSFSDSSEGTVAKVTDGDSIVLTDGRTVRYLGIDCPEAGLPGADEAQRCNRRMVQGKKVRLSLDGTRRKDRYGRLLALVHVPGASPRQRERCVNVELVRQGAAWAYFHDAAEANREAFRPLISAQKEALKQRRGVWRIWLTEAIPTESLVCTPVRIHRTGCPKIGEHPARGITTLVKELGEGRSPCRACRPLQHRESR